MSNYSYHQYSYPWWSQYYGPPEMLEYLGYRTELLNYSQSEGVLKQILRIFSRKIDISTIINALANFKILDSKDKQTMLGELFDIYEKFDAKKTMNEWIEKETRAAKKTDRFFTIVGKPTFASARPLEADDFRRIDEKFVILNGNICRKSALSTNPALLESANKSACEWVLCAFPPLGMTAENEEFDGVLVNLELDDIFKSLFADRVPFEREIAWFPNCTIAGFFHSRKTATQNYPYIRPSLIKFQRPNSPVTTAAGLGRFITREIEHPIKLGNSTARLYLYYLVPTMYRAWDIGYDKIDSALLTAVRTLIKSDRNKIDDSLKALYSKHFNCEF